MTFRASSIDLVMASAAAAADSRDLVARLRAGETAALSVVYAAHHRAVRAFATRLLGDADVAQELVHDVFVALPSAVRSFRGDADLRTFMLSIASNLSKNHIRAAVRKRRALDELSGAPAPRGADPERAAADRELVTALSVALDELSDAHRVVFVLCEIEERSAAEVARIVGAREATVRTRLFHARQKVRERLEAGGHR